jgi:hypothetical protein
MVRKRRPDDDDEFGERAGIIEFDVTAVWCRS